MVLTKRIVKDTINDILTSWLILIPLLAMFTDTLLGNVISLTWGYLIIFVLVEVLRKNKNDKRDKKDNR